MNPSSPSGVSRQAESPHPTLRWSIPRLIAAPFIVIVVLAWCLVAFCVDPDGLRALWREVRNGR